MQVLKCDIRIVRIIRTVRVIRIIRCILPALECLISNFLCKKNFSGKELDLDEDDSSHGAGLGTVSGNSNEVQERLRSCITGLALCHNVTPSQDEITGETAYQVCFFLPQTLFRMSGSTRDFITPLRLLVLTKLHW